MAQERDKPTPREKAAHEIIQVFENLKFGSTDKYKEIAETFLSQAVSLKSLYGVTEKSRNKHVGLKRVRTKEKGISFKALEAIRELRDHALIDYEAHNIELKTRNEIFSKIGIEFGLDQIVSFMEVYDEHVQKIPNIKSKSLEHSLAYFMSRLYYEATGRLPKANDNDMELNSPFEKVCAYATQYAGIKITKGQMQKACKQLENELKSQGEYTKK